MSPICALGPVLSRIWEAVWFTCPAEHAERAVGVSSRTPTVATRSARFTAVDPHRHEPLTCAGCWAAVTRRDVGRVGPSLTGGAAPLPAGTAPGRRPLDRVAGIPDPPPVRR